MTDFPSDDSRLRATETQMRHALGLHGDAPTRSSPSGSQPQRRRFVRVGEVPVTVIRRDHQPDGEHGANQLDAARQAIRSEATAKERAERLLAEAQAVIRDLQTKLGHERLAKDEALETVRRLETETRAAVQVQQAVEAELAAERLARHNAENALAEALEARQEADGRTTGQAIARQPVQRPPQPPHGTADAARTTGTVPTALDMGAEPDATDTARLTVPVGVRKRRIAAGASAVKTDRGHVGPASDESPAADVVEWWKPGWQERFR